MKSVKIKKLPSYTKSEEILNSVTHGLGIIAAIIGTVFLLLAANKNVKSILCDIIYVGTMLLLYIVSTVYHALPLRKIKAIFRKFDHCSISLFIAGTYTPICVLLIKGTVGYTILGFIWAIAVLGVVLNLIDVNRFSKLCFASHILMGWTALLSLKPLIANLSGFQLMLLFVGGLFYTIGSVIYLVGKKVKFMHSLWHLFVLAGSVFHFFLVYSSCFYC